jgi:peptidoglycan/LPS O-acetylase OafA/YrhL
MSSASSSPQGTAHFRSLDSMRGIAALLVAIYHVNWLHPLRDWRVIHNAPFCVDLFFVLSGFVICYSYGDRLGDTRAFARFMWTRLGRLYPLHLATLLVFALWHLSKLARGMDGLGGENLPAFISNLFLVHSLGLHDYMSFNYPSWSISVELWAYVMFGLVVLATGTGWARIVTSLVIVISSALMLGGVSRMPLHYATVDLGYFRCLAGFFSGVLTFHVWQSARHQLRITTRARAVISPALLLTLALFVGLEPPDTMNAYALLVLVPCIILALTLAPTARVSAVLNARPLVWLGKISYSVYMVHTALLLLTGAVMGKVFHIRLDQIADATLFETTPLQGTIALSVYLIGVLVIASFTYRWLEEPFRERAKRAAARWWREPARSESGAASLAS